MTIDEDKLAVLVGRPFDFTGRGEDVRCSFRALRDAGVVSPIFENYTLESRRPDPEIENEMGGCIVASLNRNINIFHMNGDEVEPTLDYICGMPSDGYNIIYPQWELSVYPSTWAIQLNRFDEVWAPSRFVFDSLINAVDIPVFHMPLATEIRLDSFLGRRYFGLPESSFLFLFYFDFRSYVHRKNPFAAIKAFERVCLGRPNEDMRLVIKLNRSRGPSPWDGDYHNFMNELEHCHCKDRIILLDRVLGNNEIGNLVRCCDCFASLHRSEGYGRGLAEAMFLGKPALATAYSGNMDFMNEENSCLVQYDLVNVGGGQYPCSEGQVWAEPDIDQAVFYMLKLLDERDWGRKLGRAGSRHIRTYFSYRAIGLRYKKRLCEILQTTGSASSRGGIELR